MFDGRRERREQRAPAAARVPLRSARWRRISRSESARRSSASCPATARGQLMEAEHLVRCGWASGLAAGAAAVLDAGCGVGIRHGDARGGRSGRGDRHRHSRGGDHGRRAPRIRRWPVRCRRRPLPAVRRRSIRLGGVLRGHRARCGSGRGDSQSWPGSSRPDGVLAISSPQPRRLSRGQPAPSPRVVPRSCARRWVSTFANVALLSASTMGRIARCSKTRRSRTESAADLGLDSRQGCRS